jgi:hypothetical protein
MPEQISEKLAYMKYYEHDGALRALANRSWWIAAVSCLTTFIVSLLFFYVRVQQGVVIAIDKETGEAKVLNARGPERATPITMIQALAAGPSAAEQPSEIEGRAVVRKFLENYLTYTPTTVEQNWANALNLMTQNMRQLTLAQLRESDTLTKVREDKITSTFRLRSMEPVKGHPWAYTAFGVREIHRIRNNSENTDRLVTRYTVRLLQTTRSERSPNGLLVAEYSEAQMVGERDNGLNQPSLLIGDTTRDR